MNLVHKTYDCNTNFYWRNEAHAESGITRYYQRSFLSPKLKEVKTVPIA